MTYAIPERSDVEAISCDRGRVLLSSSQGNLTTLSAGDHLWLLGVGLLPRESPQGAMFHRQ